MRGIEHPLHEDALLWHGVELVTTRHRQQEGSEMVQHGRPGRGPARHAVLPLAVIGDRSASSTRSPGSATGRSGPRPRRLALLRRLAVVRPRPRRAPDLARPTLVHHQPDALVRRRPGRPPPRDLVGNSRISRQRLPRPRNPHHAHLRIGGRGDNDWCQASAERDPPPARPVRHRHTSRAIRSRRSAKLGPPAWILGGARVGHLLDPHGAEAVSGERLDLVPGQRPRRPRDVRAGRIGG